MQPQPAPRPAHRPIVAPRDLDLVSPGRRDVFVAFTHPTLWGSVLVPVTVLVGPEAREGRGVLAIGSTHGNEYEGPVGLKRVAAEVALADVRGRLVIVPTLNAAAFAAGVRDTPADGMNLNRVFPGDERGALTQRLAWFVNDLLFPHAHVVLDLHSGGTSTRFIPVSSFHHVADPAHRAAMEAAARGFGCPVTMVYHDQGPGLLTSTAERLGKVAVGTELGWGCAVYREGVAMARRGVLAAAIAHGQLRGEAPPPVAGQRLVDCSRPDCHLVAPFAGHYEPLADCGDEVAAGQPIGAIHDFDRMDEPPATLVAPHAGVLLAHQWEARVQRGLTVAVVARRLAWSTERA